MKKVLALFLLSALIGCASVHTPSYVPEIKPFSQRFYADHQRVASAVRQTFAELGWDIKEEISPDVFEVDPKRQQKENSLIISEVIPTHLIIGTRYTRVNVYVRSTKEESDVELRYMVINSYGFFKPKTYGSESLAKRFFELVQKSLD